MRKLVLLPLVVAFLIVAILGSSHTATAQAQASLEGTVTVNGELAPADVGLVAVLEDGTECGRALTGAGGTFTMSLAEECPARETVFFDLTAAEERATTEVVIEAGAQTVEIAFEGLSDESLRAIGAAPPVIEPPDPDRPLIDGAKLFWLVLAVSIGGMFLLLCMVAAKLCQPHLPLLLSWCKKRVRGAGENATADDKNEPSAEERKDQELTYRRQIEGMVLILVIVAIIILGITEKISDQGLVSVLAAIVGYALGRATTSG